MLPILSLSTFLLKLLIILTFTLTKKIIFNFILAPKRWLAYTNFFAITLLHVLIICSRNCFPLSLLDFFHTTSNISLLKTLITNQFIQPIHLFLRSIQITQFTFLKSFSLYPSRFLCSPKEFLPHGGAQDSKKLLPAWNDRQPRRRSEGLRAPGTPRRWQVTPTAPAFPRQSRRGTARATAGS